MKTILATLGFIAIQTATAFGQSVKAELLNGVCVSVETNGILFQCIPFDRPLNPSRRGERDGRRVFILKVPKSLNVTTGEFLKINAFPRLTTYTVEGQTVELWQYAP